MSEARWIDLAGAANARDLGGTPVTDVDGRVVGLIRPDRLLRSDNLQGLTPADVRVLVDGHGLRAVADLRLGLEVDAEGPGPLTREPAVTVRHLSLLPDVGTDDVVTAEDGGVVLPWQQESGERRRPTARDTYIRYLDERPDSVLAALRLIASTDGATIVHCAAGKDRTGVITAIALAEVGVAREAIVADYVATAERIDGVLARLAASPTYARGIDVTNADRHTPKRETFEGFLDDVGGPAGIRRWLREHGWTPADAQALRRTLVGPVPPPSAQ